MGGHGPPAFAHEGVQVLFDANGVDLPGEPQTARDPGDVRVDHEALVLAERVAENDVCRLASDPGQGDELFHRFGHSSPVLRGDRRAGAAQAPRLGVEEAGLPDVPLERPGGRAGVVGGRPVFAEERRRDLVDADVGALRREHGCDEKLERTRVVERAPRVRIGARESAEDGGGAAALFLDGFANRDFRGSGHRRGFYGVVSAAQLSLH